jgi:hypothetical protein
MQELVDATKSQHELEKSMREIGGELGGAGPSFVKATDPNHSFTGGGPGDVFIASKGYQEIKDSSGRAQTWSTGPVEVSKVPLIERMPSMSHALYKGTLLETGAGGPGGGLVPPFYQPGVVDKLFEPIAVRDVFGQSTTTASQVRYVVEGTALSGAAGVGGHEARVDDRDVRGRRAGQEDRDHAPDLRRVPRGRAEHPVVFERPAVAVHLDRGGASAAPRERHERADRAVQPLRAPRRSTCTPSSPRTTTRWRWRR